MSINEMSPKKLVRLLLKHHDSYNNILSMLSPEKFSELASYVRFHAMTFDKYNGLQCRARRLRIKELKNRVEDIREHEKNVELSSLEMQPELRDLFKFLIGSHYADKAACLSRRIKKLEKEADKLALGFDVPLRKLLWELERDNYEQSLQFIKYHEDA